MTQVGAPCILQNIVFTQIDVESTIPMCIQIGSGGKAIHLVHILTITNWQGKTHFVTFGPFPSTHHQNPEYFWPSDRTSTKSKAFIFLIREMDCTKSSFWWLTCWPWAFQNVQGRCTESGHWSWILSWSHIVMYRNHPGSHSSELFLCLGLVTPTLYFKHCKIPSYETNSKT